MGFSVYGPKDYAQALRAVRKNGLQLQFIENQNLEIVKAGVNQNGLSLCHVNSEFHTNEVYTIALMQNGLALRYIPNPTLDLCLLAAKTAGEEGFDYLVRFIPKKFKQYCRVAVKTPYMFSGRISNTDLYLYIKLFPNGETDKYDTRYYISTIKKDMKSWSVEKECETLGMTPASFIKICDSNNAKKSETGEIYFIQKSDAKKAGKMIFKKTMYRIFTKAAIDDEIVTTSYVSNKAGPMLRKMRLLLEEQNRNNIPYQVRVLCGGQETTTGGSYEPLTQHMVDDLQMLYKE